MEWKLEGLRTVGGRLTIEQNEALDVMSGKSDGFSSGKSDGY